MYILSIPAGFFASKTTSHPTPFLVLHQKKLYYFNPFIRTGMKLSFSFFPVRAKRLCKTLLPPPPLLPLTDSTEVRLVAFYSVARLLFHSWIPAAVENNGHQKEQPNRHKEEKYWLSDNGDQTEEEEEEKAEGEGEEEGEELELFERTSPSSATATRCSTTPTAITPLTPACAEHALLRVSLILHEPGPTRRFDSRVRTTCRCLAKRLRSRKRGARHLLARAVLLLVDHGLANGSLDGLRGHFPPALRERRELRALDSSAMSVCSGDGDESDHPYDFADDDGGGDAVCTDGTVEHPRGSEYGSSYGGGRDRNRYAFRQGNMTEGRVQENGEGCGEREEGLGKDAFQYAAAVHFLVEVGGVSSICSVGVK